MIELGHQQVLVSFRPLALGDVEHGAANALRFWFAVLIDIGEHLPAAVHPYFAEVCSMRVSSHLVVKRDGAVTQYVKFTERAWHAGKSSYQGREACNDFSVGVELEGTDTLPYEAVQYDALAEVLAALCAAYPRLSGDGIVGHSDIAPGRKTDPGPAFDWPLAKRLIAAAVPAGKTPRK